MYTQCPECSTAFRVTAEVLRQAAGKVRCGGCGNAFNALEHLSEEKPASRPAAPEPEPHLPELKPDPGEPEDDALPPRISAEQSAALLKTLDELAGSDIQLEDTGIEWRLLDEEESDEPEPAPLEDRRVASRPSLLDAELSADLESRRVDEVLSSSPTPVDELLSAAGETEVDSPEVFDAAASQTMPDEELRFDDNTGLPDDYDVEASGEQQVVVPEPSLDAPEPMANLQVDLGFDDPGEWQDLLEEVGPEDGSAASDKKEMTLAEELEAIDVTDIEEDDETPPSGDQLADQMEALSLELTGIQEELDGLAGEDDEPSIMDELEAIAVDTEEGDESEDAGIELAAVEDDADSYEDDEAPAVEAAALDEDEEDEAIEIEAESSGDDELEDVDAHGEGEGKGEVIEFASLEETDIVAMGGDEDEVVIAGDDSGAFDLAAIESEVDAAMVAAAPDDDALDMSTHTADEDSEAVEARDGNDEAEAIELEGDVEAEAIELEDEADDEVTAAEDVEIVLDDAAGEITLEADDEHEETSIDDDLFAAAFETEAGIERGEPAEPVIEPLSEEEQTINMMIDQDLLAMAVTDDDGFASTIVGTKESFDAAIAEAGAEADADADAEKEARAQALEAASLPPDAPVETIIMSGDGAESAEEKARAKALKEEAAALIAAAKAEEAKNQKKPLDWRMVAGIAALAVLLAVQAIHFSRDALARVPVIQDILAPIYDSIGMPLTPAWDVTGWRVEKTKGSVDASGETLNIYTEIGNLADAAMPYPVIGVSLLDRFEESIGSRVFDPGEYLAGNVDRLALVGTGQRFSAEMTIESPTVAASGFRLNVCYRLKGRRLRCAIEDFR